MNKKYVVLGNGIAGLSAAETLRSQDREAEICIISEEKLSTYNRPLLSKTFFKTYNKYKTVIHDHKWYEEKRIEQILGKKITMIDRKTKEVVLEEGGRIPYDKCIYALGASCFVPPFKGVDKKGVFVTRTVEDFEKIRRAMAAAHHAVIIGGGVIGLEMAHELNQLDCHVTVLEAAPRVIGRLIDEESAEFLTQIICEKGIKVHTGVQIGGIEGEESVSGVSLSDGTVFPADVVIISCGIRANIQPALQSGIQCDRGVLVNSYMETSLPDVYSAGDCIQGDSINPGLWRYALRSAQTAAKNAVSEREKEEFIPLPETVMMAVADTSLFICGSTEIQEGTRTEVIREKKGKHKEFKVNQQPGAAVTYEKRFYDDKGLKGAVLIGDLSSLSEVKSKIEGR